jgi:hypothetical protein
MAIQMGKSLAFTAVSGMVAGLAGCGGAPVPPVDDPTAAPTPDPAGAATEAATAEAKTCCKGKNPCKAKGGCKTDANTCKGQNECKSKGGCSSGECAPEEAAPAPAP